MIYRYVITLSELKRLQKRGAVVLADVRDKKSYEAGHVPGAVSIPYTEEAGFLECFRKGDLIVLCCDRGNLSMRATVRMRRAGYQAYSLVGGYEGYLRCQK
ncbi:MAG: rhodanese-like domain-containing protein [Lachnospiraceae bacterium]|nr:rhodanese-like domain-containing protein [Lachnospiraceae bacterium]